MSRIVLIEEVKILKRQSSSVGAAFRLMNRINVLRHYL